MIPEAFFHAENGVFSGYRPKCVSSRSLLGGTVVFGWPVVVKPVIGSGSMYTYTIGNREEVLSFFEGPEVEWFRRNRYQIIAEEYIAMKGDYHCDAIIRNGRVIFSVLQRYFSPLLEYTGTWDRSWSTRRMRVTP